MPPPSDCGSFENMPPILLFTIDDIKRLQVINNERLFCDCVVQRKPNQLLKPNTCVFHYQPYQYLMLPRLRNRLRLPSFHYNVIIFKTGHAAEPKTTQDDERLATTQCQVNREFLSIQDIFHLSNYYVGDYSALVEPPTRKLSRVTESVVLLCSR